MPVLYPGSLGDLNSPPQPPGSLPSPPTHWSSFQAHISPQVRSPDHVMPGLGSAILHPWLPSLWRHLADPTSHGAEGEHLAATAAPITIQNSRQRHKTENSSSHSSPPTQLPQTHPLRNHF